MKTVSLQLAKQLKEAGFPQTTYLYHVQYSDDHETNRSTLCRYQDMSVDFQHPDKYHDDRRFAAPTAEEILERLPSEVKKGDSWYSIAISKTKINSFWVDYRYYFGNEIIHLKNFDPVEDYGIHSLAEAAGKMYLYLAKNHLLKEENQDNSEAVGATHGNLEESIEAKKEEV